MIEIFGAFLLCIGSLVVVIFCAKAIIKDARRKRRGEPTPQEEAKQKRRLEIENLTNALKKKPPDTTRRNNHGRSRGHT